MMSVVEKSILDVFDSSLAMAFDYVRSARSCPGLEDDEFARLGIQRVLGFHESGRDWLQFIRNKDVAHVARSTFFDALHSPRRATMLGELESGLAKVIGKQMEQANVDYLAPFQELEGCDVFAADGHVIEHACHAVKDSKNRNVPVGTVYAMNLRNGLGNPVVPISGNGQRRHEMPAFRKTLREASAPDRPRIWVLDRAYHDKMFWSRMKRERATIVITRMKKGMTPIRYGQVPFDRQDPVNTGVVSYQTIDLEGTLGQMYEVVYRDPETGKEFQFLTTADFPRPGVVAWLYFLRWKIEKLYDTFKSRLKETKAWANGDTATFCQAAFQTMAYNLLRLLEALLGYECQQTDKKVEEKYEANLNQREARAAANGGKLNPLLRLPRMPQLSAQFIRAVRNSLLDPRTVGALLAVFVAAFSSYL